MARREAIRPEHRRFGLLRLNCCARLTLIRTRARKSILLSCELLRSPHHPNRRIRHERCCKHRGDSVSTETAQSMVYPFPLRHRYLAQIVVPRDMTKEEAARLCAFINSLACSGATVDARSDSPKNPEGQS